MNLHLIYFSPGGTTKKTVMNIAKGFPSSNVQKIDMLSKSNREKIFEFGKEDVVILGMMTATKLFGVPNEVIGALKGNDTPFVGIVTCGNGYYGSSLKVMKKAMEKRGFKMVAAGGFIGQYSFSDKIAGGRPDEADEIVQKKFGEDIYHKLIVNNDRTFKHKLKIDWPNEGAFSTFKCALISALPGLGFGLPKSWNELEISNACIQCGKCVKNCPVEALALDGTIQQDRDLCFGCQACNWGCLKGAIKPISSKLIKSINNVTPYRTTRKEPIVFI